MDALILSCGTGGGHNSAGKAISEELKARNHHAVMINPYILCGHRLAEKIDSLYINTASLAPKAFGAVYQAGELYRKMPFRSPVYYANSRMAEIMAEYLAEHHFDIVIMPHLFPAEILTNMKHQGRKVPATMFVATDYCCIPFTEETDCDAYVIPGADLEFDFSDKGIPTERIYVCGIPVQSCFGQGKSKWEARASLGLAPEGKYILIAGGSMGAGKIEKFCGMLLKQTDMNREAKVRLIAVCGSNQELYGELRQRYEGRMTIVGHTDRMAEYLAASDLYLTKPGGLSSTEAAVMGVPLMHMPAIPGCETHNAAYFQKHHMSLPCEISEDGAVSAFRLLEDGAECEAITANQKRLISPNGASLVCALAERMVEGRCCSQAQNISNCAVAIR